MRVTLELDGVQVRGADALRQPLVWPVWFAIDGDTMRALLGDVTATVAVHAPGPQAGGAPLAWDRTLAPSGLPDTVAGVGLALLYTEGGATAETARAQYAGLATRVRSLALAAAAEASGLAPLVGVGRAGRGPAIDLAALTAGVELDAGARADVDTRESAPRDADPRDGDPSSADAPSAEQAEDAFAHVAALLARVAPGSALRHTDAIRPTIIAPVPAPPAPPPPERPDVPGLVTRPGVVRDPVGPGRRPDVIRPDALRPDITRPDLSRLDLTRPDLTRPDRVGPSAPPGPTRPLLSEGTVAVSFAQFWPAAVVATRPVADIRRALPTHSAVREALRASLTLSGRVRREG